MREVNEGGQPGQTPEGGVPSVGPGRGGKPLTGIDGPNGWMNECVGTSSNCDKWNVNLMLCNANINFKVDTGADVTVMKYECYQNISPKPILIKSKRKLFTPAGKIKLYWYFSL